MCTANQIKKNSEVAEKRGRRVESNDLGNKVLKKEKRRAQRQFEKNKAKDKDTHHKRPNGEAEFQNMKETVKKVGEEMKRKKAKRKIRA